MAGIEGLCLWDDSSKTIDTINGSSVLIESVNKWKKLNAITRSKNDLVDSKSINNIRFYVGIVIYHSFFEFSDKSFKAMTGGLTLVQFSFWIFSTIGSSLNKIRIRIKHNFVVVVFKWKWRLEVLIRKWFWTFIKSLICFCMDDLLVFSLLKFYGVPLNIFEHEGNRGGVIVYVS